MNKCNSFLVLLALACATFGADLPSEFKKCSLDQATVSECLKVAIPIAMAQLGNGSPELGAVPLEPLTIPSISIKGNQGSVSLEEQSYKDVKIHNLTQLEITNIQSTISPGKFTLDIELFGKEVRSESMYTFKGRILLLPIDGTGGTTSTYGNVKMNIHLAAEEFETKGKSYYKVTDLTLLFEPETVKLHFENIIRGNEALTAETNRILNENWNDIKVDIKPAYEQALSDIAKAYINNIFSKVEKVKLFA